MHIYACFFYVSDMNLNRLNAVARVQNEPTRPVKQMLPNQSYKIRRMRFVSTRYGARVIVELIDFGTAFLPPRIWRLLHDNNALYQDLQGQIENQRLSIRYLGGRFNAVEFLEEE